MTARAVMTGLLRRGKQVFEGVLKETAQKVRVHQIFQKSRPVQERAVTEFKSSIKDGNLQTIWRTVVPRFYFSGVASRMSRQAAWRRNGSALLLAFNTGLVMSKRSEDEISNHVQNLVKNSDNDEHTLFARVQQLSLDKFEFGRHIGQGCNAAVYEARLLEEQGDELDDRVDSEAHLYECEENEISDTGSDISDSESDITVLSSSDGEDEQAPCLFQVEEEVDRSDDDISDTDSDISLLEFPKLEALITELDEDDNIVVSRVEPELFKSYTQTDESIDCSNVTDITEDVNTSRNMTGSSSMQYMSLDSLNSTDTGQKFDLAIKMMFNYGIDSNVDAILRAMDREAVPSMLAQTHEQMNIWQNGHKVRKKQLPPHPNIVEMWGLFVDQVPQLPDCLSNYPAALPARIYQDGIGRNMTMFLVMKKYPTTLKDYISVVSLSFRERLYLLAQLLEGVAHMGRHQVAHRDMKSDNILLDTDIAGPPKLVISDFGCCLADDRHGLCVPYVTDHTDRGGNTALMAPEISTAEPGMFSYLDYRKADLWGAGAMAFEILGADNPFYSTPSKGRLDSRTYTQDDLPPLSNETPGVLKRLIYRMLERNPSNRPSPRLAADVLQLLLWAPSHWLLPGNQVSRSDAMWWIITMATEVHFGKNFNFSDEGIKPKSTISEIKKCFLQDFNLNRLQQAFSFFDVSIYHDKICE